MAVIPRAVGGHTTGIKTETFAEIWMVISYSDDEIATLACTNLLEGIRRLQASQEYLAGSDWCLSD